MMIIIIIRLNDLDINHLWIKRLGWALRQLSTLPYAPVPLAKSFGKIFAVRLAFLMGSRAASRLQICLFAPEVSPLHTVQFAEFCDRNSNVIFLSY